VHRRWRWCYKRGWTWELFGRGFRASSHKNCEFSVLNRIGIALLNSLDVPFRIALGKALALGGIEHLAT
jgi:hypothetical protein